MEDRIMRINDIKAYSDEDAQEKLAAAAGDYDQDRGSVEVLPPWIFSHGGPQVGETFTLAFHHKNEPMRLKKMEYRGVGTASTNLDFIPEGRPS
jgi:hypothetical protein